MSNNTPTSFTASPLTISPNSTGMFRPRWRTSASGGTRSLPLIPTYLHSQTDRLSASHVCRHRRRTFLQHAALWSHLFLSNGEVYVKTHLERARGSPLDIITDCDAPVGTVALLSSHRLSKSGPSTSHTTTGQTFGGSLKSILDHSHPSVPSKLASSWIFGRTTSLKLRLLPCFPSSAAPSIWNGSCSVRRTCYS